MTEPNKTAGEDDEGEEEIVTVTFKKKSRANVRKRKGMQGKQHQVQVFLCLFLLAAEYIDVATMAAAVLATVCYFVVVLYGNARICTNESIINLGRMQRNARII